MSNGTRLELVDAFEDAVSNAEGVLRASLFGQEEMTPGDNRKALHAALHFVDEIRELISQIPDGSPVDLKLVK